MITWMQRHKKYLIITIWISTIAFVGAGFVGWGQYSYGDKAGAVAKVGEVEITMGDLQKSYSRLYSQYAQMFQGNFDEERAKQFGLQRQALAQLTQQALILNLAKEYDLKVSDKELLDEIKTQKYFFKDGVFNKEVYKTTLSRNRLSMKEYENDVRKQLLIEKVLKLFPVKTNSNEEQILTTLMSIADKINYKVLDSSSIKVTVTNDDLKKFWEDKKENFKTEITYDIEYIKHTPVNKTYSDKEIKSYYNDNKTHFKDNDGKILTLEKAKADVISELNAKASKKSALKDYIAYKKNKLDKSIKIKLITLSSKNNPFNDIVLTKVASLSLVSPYLKPILVDGVYYTIKLIKVNQSKIKSFDEVKAEILPIYKNQKAKEELISLAKKESKNFVGKTTDFITNQDALKLEELSLYDANEFLVSLFETNKKRGYIQLKSGKIVLYNILEQKLLKSSNKDLKDMSSSIANLKSGIFNEGLIKKLQQKYKTEIFIEGL
ncbi:MAG: SurA N-terminal domain-containing protein [Campylobacterales bacterium]